MQAFSVDADSTKKLGVRAPGCTVDPGTAVSDILTYGDLQVKIAEAQVTQKDPAVEGAVSKRWTGEDFKQHVGLSNTDAVNGKIFRVYYKFEDTKNYSDTASKGYVMVGGNRLTPGQTYYQTTDPENKNPYKLEKAADNLYYIEITGSNIGDAYSLDVSTRFDSPASAGGSVQVWGEQVEDTSASPADASPACGVHQATWDTQRAEYKAVKQQRDSKIDLPSWTSEYEVWGAAEDPSLGYDSKTKRYYVNSLRYKLTNPQTTSALNNVGGDPAKTPITYTDTFTIPDGLEINPDYLPGLKSGWSIRTWREAPGWGDGYASFLYDSIDVNGVMTPVIGVYHNDFKAYRDFRYSVSSDARKITITWTPTKTSSQFSVKFAEKLFVTKPGVQPEPEYRFANDFTAKVSYTHTDPAETSDRVETVIKPSDAKPVVTKVHDKDAREHYFRGDPISFTIKAKNEGSGPWKVNEGKPDAGKIIDSLPSAFYVTPEQAVSMFTKDGEGLTLSIDKAKVCTKEIPKRSNTSGSQTDPEAQLSMECAEATNANFVISKTTDGKLSVVKDGGQPNVVSNDAEALKKALGKIIVTEETAYKLSWNIPDGTIYGGQEINHVVEATVKDDFMAPKDLSEASTTNVVNLNDADVPDKVQVDNAFHVDKSAYVKGKKVDTASGHQIPAGTIVDYNLTLNRNGGKADYAALPLFDDLSGAQILLAPVSDNPSLDGKGLDESTIDGTKYYILDKPGEYTGVNFTAEQDANGVVTTKRFIADRVVVSKLEDGLGLKTSTYWYMNSGDFANPSKITVKYKTLTDPDRAGFTNTRPGHPDALNIGGIKPPKYDVTDKTEMNLSKVSAGKRIVTNIGDKNNLNDDETVGQAALKPGDEVTYRLAISHVGTEPFELTGNEIYDALPPRLDGAKWAKGLVNIEIPAQTGLQVVSGDLNNWQIVDQNPADGSVSGNHQFVTWDAGLKLKITKPVYMYMTLKYPGEDSGWNDYRKAIGNTTIFNTWHVKDSAASVNHYLGGDTNPVLQKGVLATGHLDEKLLKITKHYPGGVTSTTSQNRRRVVVPDLSADGRVKYANSAQTDNYAFLSIAQYYAVVRNDGESRLYLNDLQDKLPKGFVFSTGISDENKLAKEDCAIQKSEQDLSSTPCETDLIAIKEEWRGPTVNPFNSNGNSSSEFPFITKWRTDSAKVPLTISGANSVLKKASVQAIVEQGESQRVVFKIDNSIEGSDLTFDEVRGKYYLNPGEVLAFEYLAGIKEDAYTEDTAKNTLVMPYDNFDGSIAKIDKSAKVVANPQGNNPQNDGGRQIIDTPEANHQGFIGGQENTQWLSSDVTIKKQDGIVPGVSKKITARVSSAGNSTSEPKNVNYTDMLNWEVTAYNDGKQPIDDYVISDVLDENYLFTGKVIYAPVPGPTAQRANMIRVWPMELLTFKPDSWKYDSNGKPESVDVTFENPAYSTFNSTLKVTKEGAKPEPIAVLGGRTVFHISLDMVDGRLRLNVRAVPGTDGLKAPGQGYDVPGNPMFPQGGVKLQVSAFNPKGTGDYRLVVNSGYLTPIEKEFDPNSVVHGTNIKHSLGLSTVTSDNENRDGYPDTRTNPYYCYNTGTGKICNAKAVPNIPAVRADAIVPVAEDAYTSSIKRVEEKANPENITDSNQPVNYITLPSQDSLFTYSLEVKNNKDKPLKKITLIDNLPFVGDEYSFGKLGRETQFKVDFANDPNLIVEVQGADGAWRKVDESKYVVEYSDQQDKFSDADWAGANDPKWSTEKKTSSRSIRLRLDESAASEFTVAENTTLRVRFDAKVASGVNPDPGQIAWNTFGYSYKAPGSDLTLQAIPLKVGVKVPNAIKIQKSVLDAENAPLPAKADTTYSFVVYEGAALSADELAGKTLGDALVAGNRKFTVVDVTVPQGKSQSEQTIVKPTHTFVYENGQWKPTETEWVWQPGEQYQLAEISNSSGTRLEKFTVSSGVEGETPFEQTGQLTFTYDANKSLYFGAVNKLDKWQIDLKKVDGDACKTDTDCKALKGATFGLYSTDQSEAMGEAEVKAIGEDVLATKDYNGTTYYLAKTKVSGDDGAVTFDGLNGDKYFVAELKAPSGYGATWAGWEFTKPAGQQPEPMVVKNYGTYVLPKSGGIGTAVFTVTGVLLIGGAALTFLYRRRNREDD